VRVPLAVLQAQQRDGSIPLGQRGGVQGNTAFCTLFLVHGGARSAFNKPPHGDQQDWNLHPRDLANLTKSLWSAYERPLHWQTSRSCRLPNGSRHQSWSSAVPKRWNVAKKRC